MAAEIRYVVISDTYQFSGMDGSPYNPFSWHDFLVDLRSNPNDREYRLWGERYINSTEIGDTTFVLPFYSEDTPDAGSTHVTIKKWGDAQWYCGGAHAGNAHDPWFLFFNDYAVEHIIFSAGNMRNLSIQDMMIQGLSADISFEKNVDAGGGSLYLDNCWIVSWGEERGSHVYLKDFQSQEVSNSTIISNTLTTGLVNPRSYSLEINNTILKINDFRADYVTAVSFDNVVLTSAVSAFADGWMIYWSASTTQEGWDGSSILDDAITTITQQELHYTDGDWYGAAEPIVVKGNKQDGLSATWFQGRRDGVGALWFPEISAVYVSASETYGEAPISASFLLSSVDDPPSFSARRVDYYFGDGRLLSAFYGEPVTREFSAWGVYPVSGIARSFNQWYSVESSGTAFSADPNMALTLLVLDSNGNLVTSAKPWDLLVFSAIPDQPDVPYTYDWDFDDGYLAYTTKTAPDTSGTSGTTVDHAYTIVRTVNASVTATDETGAFSASNTSAFDVVLLSAAYYVDVSNTYDVCAGPHSGTSADPYNFWEFYNRTLSAGEGQFNDVYRVKGLRFESRPTSAGIPWKVVDFDRRKSFRVEAWDTSAFGPWGLSPQDYSDDNENSIMSFDGAILKDAILYNRPYGFDDLRGGQIVLTKAFDVWAMEQGAYGRIVVSPYSQEVSGINVIAEPSFHLKGCTLYATSGFAERYSPSDFPEASATAGYSIQLTDSLVIGLRRFSELHFTSAALVMYNDALDLALSAISADFCGSFCGEYCGAAYGSEFTHQNCQFEIAIPSDFPFLKDTRAYEQTIEWLLENPTVLSPLSAIEFPPNPGHGYPTYPDYDTGLFGNSRQGYTTSGA